jgi:hypothetical protein
MLPRSIRRASLVIGLAVLAGAAGWSSWTASALTFTARAATGDPTISPNWAGYVVAIPASEATAAGSFTDVAGTWVQPAGRCRPGEPSAAAFWVGLGGFYATSQALEQVGTEVLCDSRGRPTYSALYEFVPKDPVRLKLKVRPGDRLTGAVLMRGHDIVVGLKNLTRHTRFSKRFSSVEPLDLSSAEWIAEAPSYCTPTGACGVVPLTNFGKVTFTRSAAIGNGHAGTISDETWDATPVSLRGAQMPNSFGSASNTHDALTGVLSADGRLFSVAWQEGSARSG